MWIPALFIASFVLAFIEEQGRVTENDGFLLAAFYMHDW